MSNFFCGSSVLKDYSLSDSLLDRCALFRCYVFLDGLYYRLRICVNNGLGSLCFGLRIGVYDFFLNSLSRRNGIGIYDFLGRYGI